MLEFPTWKKVWLWGITLAFAAAAIPSLFTMTNMRWPDVLPERTINLGLDLAGGSHFMHEQLNLGVGVAGGRGERSGRRQPGA